MLPLPTGMMKHVYKTHRLVILPDFQGLGIGTKVHDFIAKLYVEKGYKYYARTTHVRMISHFKNSNEWKESSSNNQVRSNKRISDAKDKKKPLIGDCRVAGSYEYVGNDYFEKEIKKIVIDDDDDNIEENITKETMTKEKLQELKDKYYLIIITGKPKCMNELENMCLELGIRTEQLYYNKNGKLIRKNIK